MVAKFFAFSPLVLAAAVLGAPASSVAASAVLRVGPGQAFVDIQSAVDAAVDGDLILVEPGTYEPFVIPLKGVTVQGNPTFAVNDGSGGELVRILGVPLNSIAAIRGMTGGNGAGLSAEFCPGEVIVEDVSLIDPGGRTSFEADTCARLYVTDLTIVGRSVRQTFPPTPTPLTIENSSAALTKVTLNGGGSSFELMTINDSQVVLAAPQITAMKGADGSCPFGDPDGAIGGAGILLDASTLIVTGNGSHFIRGGEGGAAGSACGFPGTGGMGGPGIRISGASNVVIPARIALEGGPGGAPGGGIAGAPGNASEGPVDRTQALPYLDMSPANLGGNVTMTVDAVPAGASTLTVFLVASGLGNFSTFSRFGGPFLLVSLAPPIVLVAGTTNASGALTVIRMVPPDPMLQGFALHVQGAVVDPVGPNYLTNVVVRGVAN